MQILAHLFDTRVKTFSYKSSVQTFDKGIYKILLILNTTLNWSKHNRNVKYNLIVLQKYHGWEIQKYITSFL